MGLYPCPHCGALFVSVNMTQEPHAPGCPHMGGGVPPVNGEVCTFRYGHDPATLSPKGRACKAAAVEAIFWKDGRTSVACQQHGFAALTHDAKALVLRIEKLHGPRDPEAGGG